MYPLLSQFPLLIPTAAWDNFDFHRCIQPIFGLLCVFLCHTKFFIVYLPLRQSITSTEKSCLGTPLRATYPLLVSAHTAGLLNGNVLFTLT